MTKEKVISLTKYQTQMKDKLAEVKAGRVPPKHTNSVATYTQFLNNELSTVTKKLDDAKMEGVK